MGVPVATVVIVAGCEFDHGGNLAEAALGLRLCHGCVSDTRQRLAEIPRLSALCIRPLKWDDTSVGRSSKGDRRAMPMPTAAIELRVWISSILKSWAELVVSEDITAVPPAREIASTAGFLYERLLWLAAHPSAAEFRSGDR